ncbi:MAG: helix-turn-helix domain-containing protein [Lachnospiraceae bacterium]
MKCRTEYDLKVIGRNLRRLRERKHLTVEQVREYLCLGSVQAVYKYEAGVGYPQADTMLALMELYGAGVKEIVNHYEEEQDSSSSFYPGQRQRRVYHFSLKTVQYFTFFAF